MSIDREQGSISKILVVPEGHYLDDTQTVIVTYFVETRDVGDRTPIAGLVKGSQNAHAIPNCGTVHVCTLKHYRQHEDPMVRDENEGRASHVHSMEHKTTSDPVDRHDRETRVEALNRGAALADEELQGEVRIASFRVSRKLGTITTRRRKKTEHSITHGKNGWIFCTTIMPRDRQEHSVWKEHMGDRHCISLIDSPRKFARALAEMTACQLGPQCRDVEWTMRFGKHNSQPRSLRSQTVFHGPVIYTDDVYRDVSGASSDLKQLLLPVFTKHRKYCYEREYRFFIFSEAEPTVDCVDLRVPLDVMATIRLTKEEDLLSDLPTGETQKRGKDRTIPKPNRESNDEVDNVDNLEMPWDPLDPFDLLDDPSVPVAVEDIGVRCRSSVAPIR